MAIISCPLCQKQISDKATRCNHCDGELNTHDAEAMESVGRVNRIKMAQSIQSQNLVALLLFVGGFTLWYWQNTFDDQWYNILGQVMIAVGFTWYSVNRVRLMLNKRKK